MKIASWNVNSINSRLENLLSWLTKTQPDIVLLQELKCQTLSFPKEAIEDLGYNLAIHGQKTYNGVAILSKYPIDEFTTNLSNDPDPLQARYIEACISTHKAALRIASVYVPNGQEIGSDKFEYKLKFLDALKIHLQQLLIYDEMTVIGGDFNVAPEDIDVYDHAKLENCICFSSVEQQKLQQLLLLGYTDAYRLLNKYKQEFSWWDYRAGSWQHNHGMRIDHFLLSAEAVDLLTKAEIEKEMRGVNKPSDHAPVTIELLL
jgi:exodeoxyribonuclease III